MSTHLLHSQYQAAAPAMSLDLDSPDSHGPRGISRGISGESHEYWTPRDPGLDHGMRVIGHGQKALSEMGSRPPSIHSFDGTTRTGTPFDRLPSRPQSSSTHEPTTRSGTPATGSFGRQGQLFQSHSLGSLSTNAMSLDVHNLQSSPMTGATNQRRLIESRSAGRLEADPIRKAISQSRSVGRLDVDVFPALDPGANSGASSTALTGWGNPGKSQFTERINPGRGLFTERTDPGPGLFRGFKLLSGQKGGPHKLPPCSPTLGSRPASSQDSPMDLGRNNLGFGVASPVSAGAHFVPKGDSSD